MPAYVGSTAIDNVYVGSTQAVAVCLGSTQIWPVPTVAANLTGVGALSATVTLPSAATPAVLDAAATIAAAVATSATGTYTGTTGATAFVLVATRTSPTVTSVTYGGVSMTLHASQVKNNVASSGALYCYKLAGIPGGTQTVTANLSASANTTVIGITYADVTTIGSATKNFGTGTVATTGALTCSTNQLIVAMLEQHQVLSSATGGTSRFMNGGHAIRDSTTSATFTATATTGAWATIGIVLS